LTNLRPKIGFCAVTAVIAASTADPIVEFCSNAGLFGPGHYTDRSNLDVVPALLAGLSLLLLYLVRRAPAIVSARGVSWNVGYSPPAIFVLQLAAVYLMETAEQFVVYGHPLGPTIWLGAPPLISLTIHAAIGIAVTFAIVRWRRTLAATTLRVIRLIRAIATFAAAPEQARVARRPGHTLLKELFPALRAIGDRAPPSVARPFHASSFGGNLCRPLGGFALPS
jgi:hypothetical protein